MKQTYPLEVASSVETDRPPATAKRPRDTSRFEQVFRAQYTPVRRLLYRMLGDDDEADDVAQETFLALYTHPHAQFDDDATRAWVFRVALNRGYNALRSRKRAQARLPRLYTEEQAPDPEAEALRVEERQRVRAALATLPERQAKLLVLRQQEGLKYAEIATILEVAAGSVGTLLVRAERAFELAWNQLNTTPSSQMKKGES
ncbi:MAG TPA: sigma-70 family RNA polymerase sigma factor [Ktedonobacterales bacterium]|nr:sigma-70 family RNA polymerase sigma factor [Ktedonobacterales bacterium]